MSIVSKDIQKAVSILNNDDVVAIPTETVYGLAGNIFSEKAIRKIFEIKQRPLFNPLIVHVHSLESVEDLVSEFPEKARKLARAFWPGSLTLVLKKKTKSARPYNSWKRHRCYSNAKSSSDFTFIKNIIVSIGCSKCESIWLY
jgi:tRNA threonylcarbamoyl adenosine modification protein (Sua5/YciO/YrdC/YwlC family)